MDVLRREDLGIIRGGGAVATLFMCGKPHVIPPLTSLRAKRGNLPRYRSSNVEIFFYVVYLTSNSHEL